MDKVIIETERMILREMVQSDYEALSGFLQDSEVMYAYDHPFNGDEVQGWLDRQLERYAKYGFGLWAIILKENGLMIGDCGITYQNVEGKELLEIGYHLNKAYWHRGYASEAAIACRDYAFNVIGADEICSIIRDTNKASQNVAINNGMKITESFSKQYSDSKVLHYIYTVKREN